MTYLLPRAEVPGNTSASILASAAKLGANAKDGFAAKWLLGEMIIHSNGMLAEGDAPMVRDTWATSTKVAYSAESADKEARTWKMFIKASGNKHAVATFRAVRDVIEAQGTMPEGSLFEKTRGFVSTALKCDNSVSAEKITSELYPAGKDKAEAGIFDATLKALANAEKKTQEAYKAGRASPEDAKALVNAIAVMSRLLAETGARIDGVTLAAVSTEPKAPVLNAEEKAAAKAAKAEAAKAEREAAKAAKAAADEAAKIKPDLDNVDALLSGFIGAK